MSNITKVDFDEYVRTTNMFFIDEEYEESMEKEITYATDTLCMRMRGIFTDEGLEAYIRDDKEALDNLISIMNISSEKFKRVITTLRLEKGHTITGEWDLAKIRAMMIERKPFMQEVCYLLRNGANDPKYQQLIPKYYLENFVIDNSTMARLSNPDDLRRLIKKGAEGRYNIGIGNAYFAAVQKKIADYCFKEGLTFAVNKEVPLVGRVVDFAIPNERTPQILIDLSYNITTSSTQTRYKDAAEKAASKIREYNLSHDKKVALINVLDGAGWVGRQSDFRAIHLCSTYVLHLSTIEQLRDIMQIYC